MRLQAIRCLSLMLFVGMTATAQSANPCGGPQTALLTNWPQFHSDPCHTGYNPHEAILSPANVGNLVVDWTFFQPGDNIVSSPAVANGVLYFGLDGDPTVVALSARNGNFLWRQTSGVEYVGSPAVSTLSDPIHQLATTVYAPSMDDVRALDASTGQVLWTQGMQITQPEITLANGAVYVASQNMGLVHFGYLSALDAGTGAILWQLTMQDWVFTTPAVANGMVYVRCDFHNMCAFDAGTGALLWEYTAAGNPSPPAVANGVVYFSSSNRTLTYISALNAATGELLWQFTPLDSVDVEVLATPAVANGVVYVGTGKENYQGGELYAVDANTGTLLWSFLTNPDGVIESSPAVANGVVYLGSYNVDREGFSGNIYAVDASTGVQLWEYDTADPVESSPAVANGTLYVASLQYMYAFHLPTQ